MLENIATKQLPHQIRGDSHSALHEGTEPSLRSLEIYLAGIVGLYKICQKLSSKGQNRNYEYPMAWHGVALGHPLTIYHMKYSVPDCGISRTFHN